jgi:hypothetical protein
MLNNILYLGILSTSILGNIKLYNDNLVLKKEKTEMYNICKNSINNYIRCVNDIKSK